MFDSLIREPDALGWRTDSRVRELEIELRRTREDLEVLRATTARMLTAIITEMHARPEPVVQVGRQIQELADLRDPAEGEAVEELTTGEVEGIDLTNRESIAFLDRRFRWVPSRREQP
jgi:hypothetical protein